MREMRYEEIKMRLFGMGILMWLLGWYCWMFKRNVFLLDVELKVIMVGRLVRSYGG